MDLTALLIAPNRELARQFSGTLPAARTFQVLSELKSYPTPQVMEMRIRQLQPDVILLDLSTDLSQACELIQFVVGAVCETQVVGLHTSNDSEVILRTLRLGASEFLYSPFEIAIQRQAVARLRRLRQPETPPAEREPGKIVLFASAKPGSGASTLAAQTAFVLERLTEKRVLLADFDLMGGSISFYLHLKPNTSLLDALRQGEAALPAAWPSLVTHTNGLDVLTAPLTPATDSVEPSRLHDLLEYARRLYGWIFLDAPAIFHRISLLALSESDSAFLVSTAELPSLHLARKAVTLLEQLGFPKDRFQVLINRVGKNGGLSLSDMEKLFGCPVHAAFPNDYFPLDRTLTLGRPLDPDCELGKEIEEFAGRLAGVAAGERRKKPVLCNASPAFSLG